MYEAFLSRHVPDHFGPNGAAVLGRLAAACAALPRMREHREAIMDLACIPRWRRAARGMPRVTRTIFFESPEAAPIVFVEEKNLEDVLHELGHVLEYVLQPDAVLRSPSYELRERFADAFVDYYLVGRVNDPLFPGSEEGFHVWAEYAARLYCLGIEAGATDCQYRRIEADLVWLREGAAADAARAKAPGDLRGGPEEAARGADVGERE